MATLSLVDDLQPESTKPVVKDNEEDKEEEKSYAGYEAA
jgi:hypothetical protein